METVNETPKIYNGNLTEEQVAAFKAQHRKSFAIEIKDGDEVHIGYFKRPTLETLKAVTKVARTDEVEAGKVMFDNCWLEQWRKRNRAELIAGLFSDNGAASR